MTTEATPAWKLVLDETKRGELVGALERAGGNITRASVVLGISRQAVTQLIRKYALKEYAATLRVESGATRITDGKNKGKVLGRPRAPEQARDRARSKE